MKRITISSVVAVTLLLSFFSLNTAFAQGEQEQPFQAIWNAIANLQEQITNISLTPGPQGPQGEQGPTGELPAGYFPTHAFDSGWVTLPSHTAVIDVPHNVGGDINDYFIDATYRRPAENGTFTSHQTAADKVWWEDVESNNIQLITNGDVTNEFDAARIRIWQVK